MKTTMSVLLFSWMILAVLPFVGEEAGEKKEDAPEVKEEPVGEENDPCAEARSRLRGIIDRVLTQKTIRFKYKAVLEAPGSDPMVYEGTSLWVRPGVVYVHYKASGGDEKMIIGVGKDVWIYNDYIGDWMTAEEMGDPGAGRGVQNVEAVLLVLRAFDGKIEEEENRFKSEVKGEELERMMRDHGIGEDFEWDESSASAETKIFPATELIEKFSFVASLEKKADEKGGVAGTFRYGAEVTDLEYGVPPEFQFTSRDEEGREIDVELSPEIQKTVTKLKESSVSKEEKKGTEE